MPLFSLLGNALGFNVTSLIKYGLIIALIIGLVGSAYYGIKKHDEGVAAAAVAAVKAANAAQALKDNLAAQDKQNQSCDNTVAAVKNNDDQQKKIDEDKQSVNQQRKAAIAKIVKTVPAKKVDKVTTVSAPATVTVVTPPAPDPTFANADQDTQVSSVQVNALWNSFCSAKTISSGNTNCIANSST